MLLHSLRLLRRSPGFAAAAILTLPALFMANEVRRHVRMRA